MKSAEIKIENNLRKFQRNINEPKSEIGNILYLYKIAKA